MHSLQYIQQSLTPDEELVHAGYFHWMYTLQAYMNIVFGVVFGLLILVFAIKMEPLMFGNPAFQDLSVIQKVQALHPGIKIVTFFVILLGILKFVQMMIVKATTEIAITNKRLVYKRGLVARYVGEMSIDRIEGVNVLQGILGRIFDYGRVMVRGMGVGEVVLPPIAEPIKFRQAIEKAKSI